LAIDGSSIDDWRSTDHGWKKEKARAGRNVIRITAGKNPRPIADDFLNRRDCAGHGSGDECSLDSVADPGFPSAVIVKKGGATWPRPVFGATEVAPYGRHSTVTS
jgi:hypothetical protein